MRCSGLGWAPEIPVDWNLIRAKFLLTKLDRAFKAEDTALICTNKGKVIERGETNYGLVSSDEMNYQGVHPGDLLIHGMDTWHGAIAMSELDGKCTTVVHVCDSDQDKRFLCYYYQALAFQNVYKLISNGIRQNTSDFRSFSKFGEIPTFVPPLHEQQRIADYLDKRCAAIDEVRKTITDEIEALRRLRKATIHRAVTKGLDDSVPMRDSGADWIGEIPENWSLVRLRYCLTEINELNNPIKTEQILSLMKDVGVIPYEEKGNVGNKAKTDVTGYKLAYPNTIVANSMNVIIGSVGISPYFGCVSPAYYVLKTTSRSDLRFINYVFNTREFQKELRKYANGILEIRLRISSYDLFRRKIPLPPLHEQQHIADYLDERCAAIDSVIDTRTRQLERLEDYRRALIFAYVTGKKEVPSHE